MSGADQNGATPDPTPAPATHRRYLRDGLPTLYREQPFTMQLVSAFERVLDPTVALLDGLPAHFDPELAPLDILELTAGWLGVRANEQHSSDHLRELVAHAAELGRLRGTCAGLQLELALSFPALPLRVEDGGGVTWSTDGTVSTAPPPSFAVYCDQPLPPEQTAAVARLIEAVKPVHVAHRLHVEEARHV